MICVCEKFHRLIITSEKVRYIVMILNGEISQNSSKGLKFQRIQSFDYY